MKYLKFYTLLILICLISCRTNKKINGLKHGKWVSYDTIDKVAYKFVEFYKKGNEVRTWKTFKNSKKYKKEKYDKLQKLQNLRFQFIIFSLKN